MENQTKKSEIISKMISAAMESPELKAKLIENPKGVLEFMTNFKLPEDFEIVVHEDTPNKLNIVLPSNIEELSELELSAVSGGVCWDNCDSGCH